MWRILPCAPYGCDSDEENTVGAKRLKGEGPAFIVHPSHHFKELNGAKGGVKVFSILITL